MIQQHKQSRRRTIYMIVLLILIFVLHFMLKLATMISQHDTFLTQNESPSGGIEIMLRNFVNNTESGKERTIRKENNNMHINNTTSVNINHLIDRSHRVEILDKDRRLAFVHIGKSGGSTISLLLQNGCMTAADLPNSCEEERWKSIPGQIEETILSKRIQFYLHTPHVESGRMAEYYNRITSVVVVARHPLERFISAFLSRHPKNIDHTRHRNHVIRDRAAKADVEPPIWSKAIFGSGDREADQYHRSAFKGCYPNLEEFAKCAQPGKVSEEIANKVFNTTIYWKQRGNQERNISLHCREICRGVVTGTNGYIQHIFLNYEAFLKDLSSNKEVFVIRTKHLWEDWTKINKMLGEKRYIEIPDRGTEAERINARGRLPVKSNLSKEGQKIICQFLKTDIKVYTDLLNRAVNLSDDDVREALEEVQNSCPLLVAEDDKDI